MSAFFNDFGLLDVAVAIFLLPISAFLVLSVSHKSVFRHGDWLATGCMGLCLLMSLSLFYIVLNSTKPILEVGSGIWLPLSSEKGLSGGFLFDSLTSTMIVIVCLISFLVHLFSMGYMRDDIRYGRYYCCLLLFSAAMLGLVLSGSLLFLFIFWELVGLSSYLLIGHWLEKKSAANAATKAFITTRIGDLGMFLGLMLCYQQSGSLNIIDIFSAVETGSLDGTLRTLAGLGIFLGAMGKSAQFPLHVWLPDAMEGPTPVNALIHATTMVAAGVYLIARMHPLFDDNTLLCIAYIGAFTAFFAATIALVQNDIKQVLAYSTISQLGYMVLGLGVGGYTSGLFHLNTHALFQGGLFLGAGAVIYAMSFEQSISRYGGLWRKLPITFACFIGCSAGIIGVPLISGWHSRNAILLDTWVFSAANGHSVLPFLSFATVLLTAFYMSRLAILTFFGTPRDQQAYERSKEVPWVMRGPLILLAVLSLIAGWDGHWFAELNPKLTGMDQVRLFSQQGNVDENVEFALIVMAAQESERPRFAVQHNSDMSKDGHGIEKGDDAEKRVDGLVQQTVAGLSFTLLTLGVFLAALVYWERKNGTSVISPAAIRNRCQLLYNLLLNKYYLDQFNQAVLTKSVQRIGQSAALCDFEGFRK